LEALSLVSQKPLEKEKAGRVFLFYDTVGMAEKEVIETLTFGITVCSKH